MDFGSDELAVGLGIAIAGFVARWVWERFWARKDASETRIETVSKAVSVVERRMDAVEVRESERSKHLGVLESSQNRLDGKVDGLQSFWRTEFTKLAEQFKTFEDKIDARLDNFRLELRSDQKNTEDRLLTLMTEHQGRVHERLNAISAEQAKMLIELVDMFAEKAGEPKGEPSMT